MRAGIQRVGLVAKSALFTTIIHGVLLATLLIGQWSVSQEIIKRGTTKPIQAQIISTDYVQQQKEIKIAQENQRLEAEKAKREQEKKRLEIAEKKKREQEKLEKEKQRLEAEKAKREQEKKRLEIAEKKKREQKKLEKEKQRLEAEKAKREQEKKRLEIAEKKKREQEKLEKEKQRLEAEKAKREQEKKQLEIEEKKKREQEKLEKEKQRLETEKAKREQELKNKLEEERKLQQEAQTKLDAATALSALADRIALEVENNWHRPLHSVTGLEATINVKVSRNGDVLSVNVIKSSGDKLFDDAAERAVWNASPLPFPAQQKYYKFIDVFNIKFKPDD